MTKRHETARPLIWLTAFVLMLFCIVTLMACTESGFDPETNAVTDTDPVSAEVSAGSAAPDTDPATEAPTESSTDKSTEETTNESTEAPTEAPTEPGVVIDPADIRFNDVGDLDLLSFFQRNRNCKVELAEDPEAGRVVRLSSADVTAADAVAPLVFFKYESLCKAAGVTPVSLADKPCVILTVKAEKVHVRALQLMACAALSDTESQRTPILSHLPVGEGWQSICFDFTGYADASQLDIFRLCFELLAGENGESMLVSGIRLCTVEEAAGYVTPDIYPLEDRTVEDYTLRLLQFNVQTENGNQAPLTIRSEMYRNLIDRLQPDVVGMEEVTPKWREWMDSYVFNDSYASVGEYRTSGGEANPIYYRTDKFDLVDSGTFWLSDTPDVAGSSLENANYPRICTWVILRDKATGTEFVHLNTHLDHKGKNTSTVANNIRKKQMRILLAFALKVGEDRPMFLSGDLNNNRLNSKGEMYAIYKYIVGASSFKDAEGNELTMHLADSRLDAPVTVDENHTATMTKYYDESSTSYNPARQPIDYVFYNPANTTALTYETFLITENGNWISDHLPVFTTFRINAPSNQS